MTVPTLHYIYDPLCGWCYAAGPLVAAAADAGVPVMLHGGGLWDAPTHIAPDKRAYIRQADARIADLAGVAFGPAYLDGLLASSNTILWSRPTTAAILAAAMVTPGGDRVMLSAIQRAHYVDGRRVVEPAVLGDLAAAIGLPAEAFASAFDVASVDDHIDESRRLMQANGIRGFPGFVMERNDTSARIHHEPFYGEPTAFVDAILTP